jgi:hypothetical protein
MSEPAVTISLRHVAASALEYETLRDLPRVELRVRRRDDCEKIRSWSRALGLASSPARQLVVCFAAVGDVEGRPSFTRAIDDVRHAGQRDKQEGFSSELVLLLGRVLEPSRPTVDAALLHYLTWLRRVVDPALLDRYEAETRCPLPRPEQDERLGHAAERFGVDVTEQMMPRFVELLCAADGLPASPRAASALANVRRATSDYYGHAYAAAIFASADDVRLAARSDGRWKTRVRLAVAWEYELAVDEPHATGTRNAAQIQAMRKSGEVLGALVPCATYKIAQSNGRFFYEGCDYGPWIRTDAPGIVVGPFTYATREAAEDAQQLRALPRATDL